MLRRHFEREQFTPKVILDTVSHEVVKAHIAAGNGIGFLPEETLGDGIVGVRVPKIPSVAIGALWRRGVARARGVEVFVDLLAGG